MVRSPANQIAGPASSAWQVALQGKLAALGRGGDGRFVDVSTPQRGFVPVDRLLKPRYLAKLIRRAGGLEVDADEDSVTSELDLTIAVSRFARQYCGAVSAVALVGLAHGVGIDLSPRRCRVMLTNVGLPVTMRRFVASVDLTGAEVLRCAQRSTSLPVTGPVVSTVDELREYVWSRLFGAHYGELFRRVREVAPKTSPVLLWTSAAEYVGVLSDAAQTHLGPRAAAPFVADRRALLESDTLAGTDGPNPLRDRLMWQPVGPDFREEVQTRQMCCLNYLLPERDGALCQNCPYLPPADRVALAAERRDPPVGAAAGPAYRRAQEVGRSRRSYQRRQLPPRPMVNQPAREGPARD